MLEKNLSIVEEKVKQACIRAGRDRSEVTLVAVSKTKPISMIEKVYDCGIRDFGENKVQELIEKQDVMAKDIKWHMLGHLQTNKIKYISEFIHCIHSADSLKVIEALEKEGAKKGVILHILLEVNVAMEDSKYGFELSEVQPIIDSFSKYPHLTLEGLMTVAPFVANPEENRAHFRNLNKLFVDNIEKKIDNVNMSVLSMGMSNDYEVAIEEGATCIRVGTEIFGRRNYN